MALLTAPMARGGSATVPQAQWPTGRERDVVTLTLRKPALVESTSPAGDFRMPTLLRQSGVAFRLSCLAPEIAPGRVRHRGGRWRQRRQTTTQNCACPEPRSGGESPSAQPFDSSHRMVHRACKVGKRVQRVIDRVPLNRFQASHALSELIARTIVTLFAPKDRE